MCNIREESATLPGLSQALRTAGFEVEQVFQEVCPVIRLGGAFENYIESLDKKNRHEAAAQDADRVRDARPRLAHRHA
ncbi:MAG: hypothetical protein HND48_11480 [Chloroflexi bacterium]|nr:hypothetical protein [Chloroflexota bacterium]